jgi:hypothetical protein
MANDLFQVVAELQSLIDQQLLTLSSPLTREAAAGFILRNQRIYSLLLHLNNRSVGKLSDFDKPRLN